MIILLYGQTQSPLPQALTVPSLLLLLLLLLLLRHHGLQRRL